MKKMMINVSFALSALVAHSVFASDCYPPHSGEQLSNGQTVCASSTNAGNMTVWQCNGNTGAMVNTGQKCTCTGSLMSSSSGKMCSGSYTTSSSTSTSTFASLYRAK